MKLNLENVTMVVKNSFLAKKTPKNEAIYIKPDKENGIVEYEMCDLSANINCDIWDDSSKPELFISLSTPKPIKPFLKDGNTSNDIYMSNTIILDKVNAIYLRNFLNSYLESYEENLKSMYE